MLFNQILEESRRKLIENILNPKAPECLHLGCVKCKGTGIDSTTGSACIHAISCSCKFCRIC